MRSPAAQLSRWSLPKRARRHRHAETGAASSRKERAPASAAVPEVEIASGQPALFQSTLGGAPGTKRGWQLPAVTAVALHALALGVAMAIPPASAPAQQRPEEPEVVFLQFSPAPAGAPPAAVVAKVAEPKPVARRATPPKRVAEIAIPPKNVELAPEPEAPAEPQAPIEAETAVQPTGGAVAAAGAVVGGTGANGTASGDGVVPGGVGVGELGDAAVPAREVAFPPRPIRKVEADYPRQAKLSGIEGRVIVRLIVGTDGGVEQDSIRVLRSIPGLDEAAVTAARQWRFTPGRTAAGKPRRVFVVLPFEFSQR